MSNSKCRGSLGIIYVSVIVKCDVVTFLADDSEIRTYLSLVFVI